MKKLIEVGMDTLGVVGLGYVGLPLAVQAAEKGFDVTGIDLNEGLVDLVNRRESPYVNDDRFATALGMVGSTALHAVTHFDSLRSADNVVICVPTPTANNVPDLRLVKNAASQVGQQLRSGQLVVLESTVSPGVTRDDVLPILEKESGLKVGEDFHLAHCPERIDPGNEQFFVGNLNRVVGGITPECTERAFNFYSRIIDADIVPLGSAEEAEFVKSWENSHRNVMIAMANQAAVICDALGMNVDNVLEGLQSKVDQFGLKLARPGIGPGGHCIPEDIHYVIGNARRNGIDTRFLDDAADLNDGMPRYAVNRLRQLAQDKGEDLGGMRVALLGLAYKEDVSDYRRSPAVEVAHILVQNAGSVIAHDPYVNLDKISIPGVEKTTDLDEALAGADAVFIATSHTTYKKNLSAASLEEQGVRYILDGRNCLDLPNTDTSNIAYQGIGK